MNLSSYLPLLVDLILKSAVLLGVAWVAAWLGRRVSAANRHLIWLAAFGQVLALPFLSAWVSAETSPAPSVGAETSLVLTLPVEKARTPVVASAMLAREPASPLREVQDWTRDHWRGGLVGTWLSVTVALLAWRLVGAARLSLLRRRSRVVHDARIEVWMTLLTAEQSIRRRVELRSSSACPVAMTWGTWWPVVMLPAEVSGWSEERLELVLRHELAHVARRDCLVRLLSQVACALYWPNPLVWLGARRLRLAQEQACDDRVLAAGAEAEAYASELLLGAQALAGHGHDRHGAAVAMAERSTLEKRILGIVDEGRDRGAAHRSTMALSLGVAVLALTGCTALRVREGTTPGGRPGQVKDLRQVEIAARFIELKADAPETKAALETVERTEGYLSGVSEVTRGLGLDASGELVRDLVKGAGAELLSTPKITVLAGNFATISVGQELRFPTGGKAGSDAAGETKGPGAGVTITAGTPRDFAKKNVGVEMQVLPRIADDGAIALQLAASVTQLESFVEFAERQPAPDTPVFQPIFSTREARRELRIPSGRTAIFSLGRMPRNEQLESNRLPALPPRRADDVVVLVFVSATEVFNPGMAAKSGR